MKERPILFSAPMVRAILEGRKTQTRRVLKEPGWAVEGDSELEIDGYGKPVCIAAESGCFAEINCPYGIAGDRLWVRESFQPLLADGVGWNDGDYSTGEGYAINYVATSPVAEFLDQARDESLSDRITPSIFMPRWASRITLEITEVRVQRVQDISAADCFAEGISQTASEIPKDPQIEFENLWDRINAKRGFGWDVNPWVWAITFKRVSE